MDFIPNPVGDQEADENHKEKVMSRMDWLLYLSNIFNKAANDISIQPSSRTITVEAFLNVLLENSD